MTTAEITRRVAEIQTLAGDPVVSPAVSTLLANRLRVDFIHSLTATRGTPAKNWRVIRNQARLVDGITEGETR